MIVFDLSCTGGHRFEGWFGSSGDFASQCERGLVTCPQCGSAEVVKAPMAPAVPAKSNARGAEPMAPKQPGSDKPTAVASGKLPPEVAKAMEKLAAAHSEALKDSKWVGKDFAEKSRAMHYGEKDSESIHGQATIEEAKDLIDEGIAVAPLPFPISPPDDLN